MTNSKVEEVALALYVADGFTHPIGSSEESWAGDREDVRERYRVQARAAIAAMRKPTPEMVRLAQSMLSEWEDSAELSDEFVPRLVAAMIDKALEEG